MPPFRRFVDDVTGEQFRVAVLLGLASIPFTVGVNWLLTTDPTSATPLFLACVLTGSLYRSRPVSATRAGELTAIAGGLPIVGWQSGVAFAELWGHPSVTAAVGDSSLMVAASVGAALVTAAVLILALVIVGPIGGWLGSWLSGRLEPIARVGSNG